MKISKRHILGVAAVAGLAAIGLVACGKNDDGGDGQVEVVTYTATLDAGEADATLDVTTVEFTDVTDLEAKLNEVKATREHYVVEKWQFVLKDDSSIGIMEVDMNTFDFNNVSYIQPIWTEAPYTITLDYKGNAKSYSLDDKQATGKVSVKYNSTVEQTKTQPTGTGLSADGNPMSFIGWYTDSELTNEYDFTSKVEGDFTLYAKWDIKTIETAQDFADYVNSDSTINAEIKKDAELDFTDITFTRDNTLDISKTSNKANGDYSVKLTHVLSGNGATLKNITINNKIKSGGLFGIITGSVTDLTFKDCTFNTTAESSALLAGQANGAIIEDVVFDNIKVTGGKKYSAVVVAQCKENKVSIDGIVVKNSTLATSDYSGVVVGEIQNNSASVSITDCVVDATLTNGASGQGCGLIVGEIKGTQAVLTIDGVFVKGSIECGKNVAGVIGNIHKNSLGQVTVKNIFVSDLSVTATGIDSKTQVDLVVGQNAKTTDSLKMENIYARKFSNTVTNTAGSVIEDGTVKLSELKVTDDVFALTSNINVNVKDLKVTFGDEKFEITADPKEDTVKEGIVSVTGATYASETKTITGTIAYEQKATHTEAGFEAGNYVKVDITADEGVTDTTGYNISGDGKYVSLTDKVITAYLKVTEDELTAAKTAEKDITKTITVVWYSNATNTAIPVDYVFTISKDVTLENYAPTYATSVNVTGATLSKYETGVIEVTGEVAYESDGNYVTLAITMPDGVDLTEATKVKVDGTAVDASAISGQVITTKIKVTGSSTSFTLAYSDVLDPITYTIKGYTLQVNENESSTKTLNVDKLIADFSSSGTVTDGIYDDFFTLNTVTVKSNSNLQFGSAKSSIKFTTNKKAKITIEYSATGSGKTDAQVQIENDTTVIKTFDNVADKTKTKFEYTLDNADTYTLSRAGKSGIFIYSLVVEYIS